MSSKTLYVDVISNGEMQMKIWSRRFTPAQGNHWKLERECTAETVQQWLAIFRKDEPEVIFIGDTRKPPK